MATFERKVTDPDHIVEIIEGNAILIADRPDFVNLPAELGGGRVNILGVHQLPFPGYGVCTQYELDTKINGKRLWVAKADQFYWHTK